MFGQQNPFGMGSIRPPNIPDQPAGTDPVGAENQGPPRSTEQLTGGHSAVFGGAFGTSATFASPRLTMSPQPSTTSIVSPPMPVASGQTSAVPAFGRPQRARIEQASGSAEVPVLDWYCPAVTTK